MKRRFASDHPSNSCTVYVEDMHAPPRDPEPAADRSARVQIESSRPIDGLWIFEDDVVPPANPPAGALGSAKG